MFKLSLNRQTKSTDECLNAPVDAPDGAEIVVGGDVDEGQDGGGTRVIEDSGLKSNKTH